MPQKAELYDHAGQRLPQTWIQYLPVQGAVIGFSKKEVERQFSLLTTQNNAIPTRTIW